jgi:hypothetical protein
VDHRGFDFFLGGGGITLKAPTKNPPPPPPLPPPLPPPNRKDPNKESNLLVRFATCQLEFVKAAAFIKLAGKRGLVQVVGDMLSSIRCAAQLRGRAAFAVASYSVFLYTE